jgi:hypothetical protein
MSYIGFTGTREGMTDEQKATVSRLLTELEPKHARHGDCVGSDADFHALVRETKAKVIIHPPDKDADRAGCIGDQILPEKPYLTRNRDIVDNCTVLIATPDGAQEKQRSGTWSTIRYGRKVGRRVIVVAPDGTTS